MGESLGWVAACVLAVPASALAQPSEVEPPPAPLELVVEEIEPPPAPLSPQPGASTVPAPAPPTGGPATATPTGVVLMNNAVGRLTIGGYSEFFYSYNFNEPPNGITNFRGFDNRHNSFTLSNAVLDTTYEKSALSVRLALQLGNTPNAIGIIEPIAAGTSTVGASDGNTWKFIQQAYISYKLPLLKGLFVQAGIFLTPIGMELIAVKDNWNWSRSNLFLVLPYYHAGVRATQQLTDLLSVTAMVFNGWNNAVDSNIGKSIGAQVAYLDADRLSFSVMYFGGPERANLPLGNVTIPDNPAGQPWRSLFDAWVQWKVARRLWLGANYDGGFELTNFGMSYWNAGALYARVQATRWLYLAARGDAFFEHAAANSDGSAARIFFPGDWVASATGTIDLQILDGLLARIEYRHDHGQADMYYGALQPPDNLPMTPITPNRNAQNTLTLGISAWF